MEALETTKYNLKAQSIIESAVFNFNRNGFYGTSLEHITRSLNMTDKSIYYYFKNKEDLFIAALHHTQESLCAAITEAKALKENALEKIQFLATQCASIDGLELLGNVPHEVTKHQLYPKIEKRLKKHHQITIGFFEMGISLVLWQSALKISTTVSRVASLVFITPFMSLVVLYFVLGERILLSTFFGLVLICTGLILQKYYTNKAISDSS